MLDEPTNAAFSAGLKRAGQDGRPDPNGRVCRGSSATSPTDLGELLDCHVYPTLASRVDRAIPGTAFVGVAKFACLPRSLPVISPALPFPRTRPRPSSRSLGSEIPVLTASMSVGRWHGAHIFLVALVRVRRAFHPRTTFKLSQLCPNSSTEERVWRCGTNTDLRRISAR